MINPRYILSLSGIFIILSGFSQSCLYNADLEHWVSQPNPVYWEEPEGWSSSNRFTGNMGCGGGPGVMADTQSFSGQYAARLLSLQYGFAAVPYPGYIVNGTSLSVDVNGEWDLSQAGTPCSDTPASLSGYYRYASWDTDDSAWVEVILTHYNYSAGKRDTVAYGHTRLGRVDTFQFFEVPLQYPFSHPMPDTVVIFIASTDPLDPVAGGDLRIDKLSLGEPGGTSGQQAVEIQAFPNPTEGQFFLRNNSSEVISFREIKAYDISGKLVYARNFPQPMDNPRFKISKWEPSIYIFRCLTVKDEALTFRIVKI